MPPRRVRPSAPQIQTPTQVIDSNILLDVNQQATENPQRASSEPWSDSNAPTPIQESVATPAPVVAVPNDLDSNAPQATPEATDNTSMSQGGLIPYLTGAAPGETHFMLIDEALRDLRAGRSDGIWIANSQQISQNCEWFPQGFNNSFILRWKQNSRFRLDGASDEALVCWIGQATSDAALSPDSGWNTSFREEDIPKRKRILRVVRPEAEARVPSSVWDSQIQGARQLIENGCRINSSNSKAGTGYLFWEEGYGSLRVRSPLFLPLSKAFGNNSEYDYQELEPDVPDEYFYETWNFSSTAVREAFDRVKAAGFVPQVMDVFDHHDNLIHPNKVQAEIPGSIVLVYATLEKALFASRGNEGGRKWQFYANLVKAQVMGKEVHLDQVRDLDLISLSRIGFEFEYLVGLGLL
ncbi:hypothetical protein RSOLAG22IIIB_05335 [Rhizoctonia solani]|uniref:Uncharacterized protein n=1 Tax=Rhizoctonia solani TaxID=456999 RepID=A0A0K6G4P5_9AGAM|nr:hypothetical protein RSOLAG22IIIB_05335 [Rhizoctonia solani]